MRVLLIEDELPAARQLTKLLAHSRPQWQVLETLDSVAGAVAWLRHFPAPDLIFMDIQIADGLSFDIFRQVNITSPVIFTTAFDQYAVQAFKVNALDYLLKPVDPEDLEKAIQKIENRPVTPVSHDLNALLRLLQPPAFKERFLVKTGAHFTALETTDIAFFRSSDGLTQAHTFSNKKHFIEHTLEELHRLVSPRDFFRTSRNMLIRVNSIKAVHPHFNGRLKLDLTPAAPEEVFVSRDRAAEFKGWLGG